MQTSIPAVPPEVGASAPRVVRPPLVPRQVPPTRQPPPTPPPARREPSSFVPVERPLPPEPVPVGMLAGRGDLPTLMPRPEPPLWFDPRGGGFLPAPAVVDLHLRTRPDMAIAFLRLGLASCAAVGLIASLRAEDPAARLVWVAAALAGLALLRLLVGPAVLSWRIDRDGRTLQRRFGWFGFGRPIPFDRVREVTPRSSVTRGRYGLIHVLQLGLDLDDGDWLPISDQLFGPEAIPTSPLRPQAVALRRLFLPAPPAVPPAPERDEGSGPMMLMRAD